MKKNRQDSSDRSTLDHETPALREPADRTAVLDRLSRILASSHFRNSKRYPALLRYVVEQTLDGCRSELKERNLGVEVFGRDPDFEPGSDPVVRISAAEVRKRLAQDYPEPGRESELRINVPLGSYLPEFRLPDEPRPAPPVAEAVPVVLVSVEARRPRRSKLWLGVTTAIIVLAACIWLYRTYLISPLDRFWHPVIAQGGNGVLCVGPMLSQSTPATPSSGGRAVGAAIAWWDAETMARMAVLLRSKGMTPRFYRDERATFEDFQQAPAVLIGRLNDQWTLRLMANLRFTFARDGSLLWIADRDHPSSRGWQIDRSQLDSDGRLSVKEDFAVISRVANPKTGRITVSVAGLWGYGTEAAGKFLADSDYPRGLEARAPAGWQDGDLQVWRSGPKSSTVTRVRGVSWLPVSGGALSKWPMPARHGSSGPV